MKAGNRVQHICKGGLAGALLCALLFSSACAQVPSGQNAIATPTPAASATPAPTPSRSPSAVGLPSGTPASVSAEDINGVAGPGDVLPVLPSYAEYKAKNDDVIGWITVPNTKIDYPVVRTADNEYYRTHNVEKNESKYGAIFMDFRNADREQQYHIILYGHNMKNGTMFHDLNNYKQHSFFEKNRVITFDWDGAQTQWEVYLAFVWHEGGPVYWHTLFNSTTPADNFADYMNEIVAYMKSDKYTVLDDSVVIKPSDQVLTLSTCTYEYDESRYVVSARRIK